MPRLANPGGDVPVCPVCDGPCIHDVPRGPFVFPDRLPRAVNGTGDPPPEKPKRPKRRRGRRPDRTGQKQGPVDHRAHLGPEHDR